MWSERCLSDRVSIVDAPRQNADPFPSGRKRENAMGMMIIRHKVRDYGHWRPIFDRHADMQKRAGLINPRVYHSADSNKSEIVVVFDTEIRTRLRTSLHLPTSKKRWRRLEFWILRRSISLSRSIKHASNVWHGVAARRFQKERGPWGNFSSNGLTARRVGKSSIAFARRRGIDQDTARLIVRRLTLLLCSLSMPNPDSQMTCFLP
jgi:hypothetical protein